MNTQHDIGVAARIGRYSDAVEVQAGARILYTAGTPGMMPDGTVPPGIEAQADWAWRNVFALLERAGMGPQHLVSVTQYLTRADDIVAYAAVRNRHLGEHRPASILTVVPALVRPDLLVEIQACAACP